MTDEHSFRSTRSRMLHQRAPDQTRQSGLSKAIVLALGASFAFQANAQPFPAELDLTGLDGADGVIIEGELLGDRFGSAVGVAGDINGDGIEDLILGAQYADPNGSNSGRSYVVFGSNSGLTSPLDLSQLNGANGFAIDGDLEGDFFGVSVSHAGDINADGIDDLVIGAPSADPNGSFSGRAYIVFGSTTPFISPLQLDSLDETTGLVLNGLLAFDQTGSSVSAIGDFNGDGIDDLIIGAPGAEPRGSNSGAAYILFGNDQRFPAQLDLDNLDGSNGFVLVGESDGDGAGSSVSGAGDFNSDGFDDVIIGAPSADPGADGSGRVYVVFGSDKIGASGSFDLNMLADRTGFALDGEAFEDSAGYSVSGAGDINGDGFNDVIVGAPFADPNGSFSGRSYIVFGTDEQLPNPLDLDTLSGSAGFIIEGAAQSDKAGTAVSNAGDINADGIDDIVIGAPDAGNGSPGISYVLYGSSFPFLNPLQLDSLDGTNGIGLIGDFLEESGQSVSAAGDIDNDGIDDLVIGAPNAAPNGSQSGRSYVVYGRDFDQIFADSFESPIVLVSSN